MADGEADGGQPKKPHDPVHPGGDEAPELTDETVSMDLAQFGGWTRLVPGSLGGYRILHRIAGGATGSVYLAEPPEEGSSPSGRARVAIKVLDPLLLEKEGVLERFLQEAEVGRLVVSPNVVQVYELGRTSVQGRELHFIVMEYAEGQTLRGLLAEMGRVSDALCRQISLEMGQGLAAIHKQGIVHRDLKPENVQIDASHRIKIMDLGVALVKDRAGRLTQAHHFVGSIPYASPEQLRGDPLDARSDLFALGAILYELSTGVHPFYRGDLSATMRAQLEETPRRPSEINPQLSPLLDELTMTLLAKEPGQRFASAGELIEALSEGEGSAWWKRRSGEMPAATRRPLRRLRIQREAGFHGREGELAALRACFDQAQAGHGQVVLIEGEPGIGKTRLVDAFTKDLEGSGEEVSFLYGAFPSGGLAALSDAFGGAVLEHLGPADLEARLMGYLPGMHLIAAPFASWLRGDPSPGGQTPLSLSAVQAALGQLLKSLAQERPVILVIEDLDYAPKQGRILFAALARVVQYAPVLLVGTTSLEEEGDWPTLLAGLEHATRLSLPRLGAKDLQGLLQEVLRSVTLADDLGAGIAYKSDGNPLFALAILQGLREARVIEQHEDGSWRRISATRKIEIPSSVRDLIAARLTGLEEADCDVLEVAACLGYSFDPLTIAEALGLERIPLLKRLGRLERSRKLVRSAGRHFEFDQHQVQEFLYEGLSEPLREEYHGLLGRAMERREGAAGRDPTKISGEVGVVLCEHFLKGRDREGARRYFRVALDHLERTSQCSLIADFADRFLALDAEGLGPGERAELLVHKARAHNTIGEGAPALSALEEAKALTREADDPAARSRTSAALGEIFLGRWESEPAQACFEESLGFAVAAGDRLLEVHALNGLGAACLRLGRHEASLEHHERATAVSRETGDLAGEAEALEGMARALLGLGRMEESKACRERAIEMCRAQGNRAMEASALTNLGVFAARMGDFEAATERFSEGASIFRGLGHVLNEAIATDNLARAQAVLGRYDDALLRIDRCLTIYRELGNAQKAGLSLSQMATWFAFVADFSKARAALEEALFILKGLGLVHRVGEVLTALGFVSEQEGDLTRALGFYKEAREHCSEEDCEAAAEAGLFTGRILIRLGEPAAAGELFSQLEKRIAPAKSPELFALAESYRASLDRERLPGALEAYAAHERRLEFHTRLECRYLQWKISGSSDLLEDLRRLMEFFIDHIPAALREKATGEITLYREILAALG